MTNTRRGVKNIIGRLHRARDSRTLKRLLSKFGKFGLHGSWNLDRFYLGLAMVRDYYVSSNKTKAQIILDWADYVSTSNLPVSTDTLLKYFDVVKFFYDSGINLENRIFDYIDIPFDHFYSLIMFANKYVNDDNHRPTVFVDRVIREVKRLNNMITTHSFLTLLYAIERILKMRAYSELNIKYQDIRNAFGNLFAALKRSMFSSDKTLINNPSYYFMKASKSHRDLVIDCNILSQNSYIYRMLMEIKKELNSRPRDTRIMYFKHKHNLGEPKRFIRVFNGDELKHYIGDRVNLEKFKDIKKGVVVIEVSEIH